MKNHFLPLALLLTACAASLASAAEPVSFSSNWHTQHNRVWLGQHYWANPMEDWRLSSGRIETIRGGEARNVHVLTHRLGEQQGTFQMSVEIERVGQSKGAGSVGFEVGIQSELGDYRSSLLRGRGVRAGITTAGSAILGNKIESGDASPISFERSPKLKLSLTAKPVPNNQYRLELTVTAVEGDQFEAAHTQTVPAQALVGNIALVANYPGVNVKGPKGPALFAFSNWELSGTKLVENQEQAFGPILYAMHSLSRGKMKMTAQMPPIGEKESQTVRLQIQPHGSNQWQLAAEASIDPLSRTATFAMEAEHWDDQHDIPYRLAYTMTDREGNETDHYFTGTVRRDPVEKETITVAGFTGNTDPAFPNSLLASNVAKHNPDVLFFSGDQIYEQVGGYGIQVKPVELAVNNYLRKIWLWGWAFRDVMRDRPTLVLPDDHDVYQGNIWGQGGRSVATMALHDTGGYFMHPEFVNAMQRTQTAHHPDAYDPTPVEQGITVYYGDMLYGRISFAIIEDRKFKSGPAGKVNTWKGRADHVRDPDFDPESVDQPGLVLLGERQLKFLDDWAADWNGADLKTVCSQTIFCNLANYHGPGQMYLVADLDSNGWPQTGRNKALRAMRKGFAFHYAGDQHLPSVVHYGVDDFGDAGFAFCVPSIAAGYPRSWRPDAEGKEPVGGRPEGWLPNTGRYLDGLGNHVTVYAIGNPEEERRRPVLEHLHDKSSGYGLVEFHKPEQKITINCYKLLFDADNVQPGDQFPGWPITITLEDNYGREAVAYLPTVEVRGLTRPVVQVIDQSNGEIVYTRRIGGSSYRPKVFAQGKYTVLVSDPESDRSKMLKDLSAGSEETLTVDFR